MQEDEIHYKIREYKSHNIKTTTVYSRMDERIVDALDRILMSIDVEKLAKLPRQEFAEYMSG